MTRAGAVLAASLVIFAASSVNAAQDAYPSRPIRLEPVGYGPDQVSARIKKESAEYAKLVKDIGYQPQ